MITPAPSGKLRTKPYTVSEAAAAIGLSYAHILRSIHRKEVPAVRLGRKYLIPAHFIQSVIDGTQQADAS